MSIEYTKRVLRDLSPEELKEVKEYFNELIKESNSNEDAKHINDGLYTVMFNKDTETSTEDTLVLKGQHPDVPSVSLILEISGAAGLQLESLLLKKVKLNYRGIVQIFTFMVDGNTYAWFEGDYISIQRGDGYKHNLIHDCKLKYKAEII